MSGLLPSGRAESHDPIRGPSPLQKRLVNFRADRQGPAHAGLVVADRVWELGAALGTAPVASMAEAYRDWERIAPRLAAQLDLPREAGWALAEVELLAPSLTPSALFFAGFNYRDHVANMMKVFDLPDDPDPKAAGIPPWHNLKPPSSLCGHGATVVLPTPRVDWEIELAVVIGRAARNVPVERALDVVAGYTIGLDLSARDRAFRPQTPVESVARMDWIAQKGFDGACPLGPWLIPRQAIADPQRLALRLSVNGEVKQDSNTREMISSVAESVAHLSSLLTLSPGDIILTGTPAGTGSERGEALKPDDVIRASIEGIGELVVTCA